MTQVRDKSLMLSIIMPVYNGRPFVGEALSSIMAQSLPADEIIIIDDGSVDGSAEYIRQNYPEVRIFVQPENMGIAAAVNRGISEARGEFIAFIDHDDLWSNNKLALQLPVLLRDPNIDGVFGYISHFADSKAPERSYIPEAPLPGITKQTLLIRRSAFEEFGFFDETLKSSDFVPWYARAVELGIKIVVLPEVIAHRRIHASNTGIIKRNAQQQDSIIGLKRALDLRRRH